MILHEPTLGVVYMTSAVIALFVLFLLWRINRDTPGTGVWTIAAVTTLLGFAVLPLRPILGTRLMAFLNNTAAVAAILLIIEGIVLFRGLELPLVPSKAARRAAATVIFLVAVLTAFLTVESARLRALFLDPILVLLLFGVAAALLYDTRGMERLTHLLGSVSSLLFALTLSYRFVLALMGQVPADTTGSAVLSLVLLVGFVWTVGITVGVVMAVNYRKQALLLTEKERAEKASELRSRFLAHMSHEVRTPLNALVGVSQMLTESELPAQQREEAEMIRDSASSLLAVINDVLDLSKIEAEQLVLDAQPFDPREVARAAVTVFRFEAQEKGLDLSFDVEDRVPPRLLGDPARLRQVLVNLVGNAIKFTEEGTVSLRVGTDQEGGDLRVAVSDTGPGIPKAKQRAIFESFVQVKEGSVRRHGGSGLGLAIAGHIVELMGGDLAVESDLGRGSTFFFTIPLRPAPQDSVPPASRAEGDTGEGRSLSVLLADDERINRKVTERLLRTHGFSVTSVANGEEVLEAIKRDRFDLILMDVEMPVLNGLEATAELRVRERESGHHTPIVAMTAYAMPGDRERFISAGMDEYLTKPLEPEELLRIVDVLFGSHASL